MIFKNFDWHLNQPLSSLGTAVLISALYIAICFVHRLLYGDKPPQFTVWSKIEWFVPFHNIILSGGSLIMFLGTLYSVRIT